MAATIKVAARKTNVHKAPIMTERARWQALDDCSSLPGKIEDWLSEPGSLTARVRARCTADFRFRLFDERYVRDVVLFDVLQPREVFCREILMHCGDVPQIFARTLVPAETLQALPWLGELRDRPLGARLFDEPGYMRGRFYIARLQSGDALYDYVNNNVAPLAKMLWARRARVELNGKPFEICECFLPGLI